MCDNDINKILFVFLKLILLNTEFTQILTKTYQFGNNMKCTTSEASEWLRFVLINKLIELYPKIEINEIEGNMEFNLCSLTFLKNLSNFLSLSLITLL